MNENIFLVINADGIVKNAVVWNGETLFDEPGCEVIPRPLEPDGVWIGWSLIDEKWVPPQPDEP
jgi:hypothetical protein